MINGSRIEVSTLIRKVPLLSMVQKQQYTWNQVGENLLSSAPKARSKPRPTGFGVENASVATAQSTWQEVKAATYQLLATDAPEYQDIRKRLVGAGNPSTLYVLSTLSLWLSGMTKLSISITTPVVATMLYAIADSPAEYAVLLEG